MSFNRPVTFISCLLGLAAFGVATNVHVNSGCIDVNSTPLCAGKTSSVAIDTGSATIYGRFDGNTGPVMEYSGCSLSAIWPSTYGDIYYGADNCLYDSTGNNINGQCCTTGQTFVVNPYNVYYG